SLSVVCSNFVCLARGKSPQFVVVLLPECRTVENVARSSVLDERVGGFSGQIPRPDGTGAIRKLIPVVVRVHPYGDAELPRIAGTLDLDRLRFRLRERGQQQRRQDCNDRDHNQKFDQCERTRLRVLGAYCAPKKSTFAHRTSLSSD